MNGLECPCGSGQSYSECCEKVHLDIKKADTAEKLMRSRYSAFVLGKGDYLKKSHHSKTVKSVDFKVLMEWSNSVIWKSLEIIRTKKGGSQDVEGYVEFKAFYMEGVKLRVLHQNSLFTRQNGHWVYNDLAKRG